MVKKAIIFVVFTICAFSLYAQENFSEFVNLVKEGAQVHFSFKQSNFNSVPLNGEITVKGTSFRLEMSNGIKVINNGETEWYVNSDNTEIVIYTSEKNSLDITRNPFAFLEQAKDMYTIKMSGPVTNKSPRVITLVAKNGVTYTIDIVACKKLESNFNAQETFCLNPDLYPNAVVTDLR